VILAAAVGYLLERLAGLHNGVMYGLLAGFLVAPLVPSPAACPLPSHRATRGQGRDTATGGGETERERADPGR